MSSSCDGCGFDCDYDVAISPWACFVVEIVNVCENKNTTVKTQCVWLAIVFAVRRKQLLVIDSAMILFSSTIILVFSCTVIAVKI